MLSGVTDFNSDGKPDYLLYNGSTRETAIWYLNNNIIVSGASRSDHRERLRGIWRC